MVTFEVTREKSWGVSGEKKFFFSFPKIKIKSQSYRKSYHVNSFLIKNKIILIWSKLIFKKKLPTKLPCYFVLKIRAKIRAKIPIQT